MPFKYFTTSREAWFLFTHPKLWFRKGLIESQVPKNPFELFNSWYQTAKMSWSVEFPNAMVLSTVSANGRPNARVVLFKGCGDEGFKFYTNRESQKGLDLSANPFASVTFYWGPDQRQIRISGQVLEVSDSDSDNYFFSRPRDSQIGAWCSRQSSKLENRLQLEDEFKKLKDKFKDNPIPRPPYWGGYLLKPDRFEFWQLRLSRLHDRIVYELIDNQWEIFRLAP